MKISKYVLIVLFSMMTFAYSQASKWMSAGSWSGGGLLQTQTFNFHGEKWRLRGSSKYTSPFTVELYDLEGNKLATLAKFTKPQSPWTVSGAINPQWKQVYMKIQGSGNGWSLSLEQFVDDIDGFKLFQEKNTVPKCTKYGMWTGEGGDEVEIPINVPAKMWKIKIKTLEKGRVIVETRDEKGKQFAYVYLYQPGEWDTWLYNSGNYVIKVTSVAAPWLLSIEM